MTDQISGLTRQMLGIVAFGLSSCLISLVSVAVAAPALDKSIQNQDNLVQETKWRNAGYFDDKDGIEISSYEFSEANKTANNFLIKNRELLNNQKSIKDQ